MFTIIIVILTDLIGFSLLVPIYPLIHDYYQITDLQIGYFVQIWAIFLCIGGLFFGILSDKTSRKTGLVIPMLGSTITYFLAFIVDSYTGLLICRAFNGFFNGNFVVAMAAAADISTPETRLKNMSAIGATLSFSWVVGPVIGGLISLLNLTPYQNIHLPFLISTLFSLFGFILTLTLFPKIPARTLTEVESLNKTNIWKDLSENLLNRKMLFYAILSILFMGIVTGSQVYWSLWVHDIFNFSPTSVGVAWGVFGFSAFLGQVVINKFLYKVNTHKLIVIGFIGMGISFIMWSLTPYAIVVYIFAMLIFFHSSFVLSGINTRISISGHPDKMGMVFGINQIFSGLGRTLAPTISGVLVTFIGYHFTWITLGSLFLLLAIISTIIFTTNWLER